MRWGEIPYLLRAAASPKVSCYIMIGLRIGIRNVSCVRLWLNCFDDKYKASWQNTNTPPNQRLAASVSGPAQRGDGEGQKGYGSATRGTRPCRRWAAPTCDYSPDVMSTGAHSPAWLTACRERVLMLASARALVRGTGYRIRYRKDSRGRARLRACTVVCGLRWRRPGPDLHHRTPARSRARTSRGRRTR